MDDTDSVALLSANPFLLLLLTTAYPVTIIILIITNFTIINPRILAGHASRENIRLLMRHIRANPVIIRFPDFNTVRAENYTDQHL